MSMLVQMANQLQVPFEEGHLRDMDHNYLGMWCANFKQWFDTVIVLSRVHWCWTAKTILFCTRIDKNSDCLRSAIRSTHVVSTLIVVELKSDSLDFKFGL